MKLNITLILLFCLSFTAFGQVADDFNRQSRELLAKGDYKNAVPVLKEAAEAGSAEAQYNYGVCFEQGVGVPKNDSIANNWFLKSANQGWLDAQFKMAYSYFNGRGYTRNYKQAFYWSLKCAAQNDPECMFNVVSCYQEGIGTDKNTDSMLVWAVRLGSHADLDNLQLSGMITSARANLATMYLSGDKVKKDLVKSYMWFLIYNESKRDFSMGDQLKNIDTIKDLEKSLTDVEKNKARHDAINQIGRTLKNLDNLYKSDY